MWPEEFPEKLNQISFNNSDHFPQKHKLLSLSLSLSPFLLISFFT